MSTQLITAEFAFPDGSGLPQRDLAVAVSGNQIVAVAPYAELRAAYPTALVAGGSGYVLLPALINSHDHGRGLGSLSLGVADDLLELWLPGLWAQPPLDPYLAALYDGLRLVRAGVGSVAHSHNPRNWLNMADEAAATIRGYRDAGVRVAFHPPLVDQNQLVYAERERFLAGLPSSVRAAAAPFLAPTPLSHADYFALCAELFRQFHDPVQHTVHLQVSPAGGQWCSDDLIRAAVDFACAHGIRVQMHMIETRYQRAYAQQTWGTGFYSAPCRDRALGPWLTLAHLVWPEPVDPTLLAAHGVGVAHNPSSNLRLRSGIAPIAALHAAGVPVGIGLDGHALDEDQDLLRELRLAWSLANLADPAQPPLIAGAIMHMATVNGAAITFGAKTPLGRLAPGYLADLMLLKIDRAFDGWAMSLAAPAIPDPEPDWPLALLLRGASRRHVEAVMVNGIWVVRNGRSTTADEAAIAAELRAALGAQPTADQRRNAAAARALGPYLRTFYANAK